jgi:hypothetical protein
MALRELEATHDRRDWDRVSSKRSASPLDAREIPTKATNSETSMHPEQALM